MCNKPPSAQTKPETEISETEISENKIQQDIQAFKLDSDLIERNETPLKQGNNHEARDSGDNKELIQVSGSDLDTPPLHRTLMLQLKKM